MESFNFLHATSSVDNSANFAASVKPVTGVSSENAFQSSEFNNASKLSFNKYLMSSINNEKTTDSPTPSETTPDISMIAKDIIAALKKELRQSDRESFDKENNIDLDNNTDDDAEHVEKSKSQLMSDKNEKNSNLKEDVLNELERIVAAVEPTSLKNELANELAQFKVNLENQFMTDKKLISEQDIINDNIDIELEKLNIELQNGTLTSGEVDSLKEQLNLLETLKTLVNAPQKEWQKINHQLESIDSERLESVKSLLKGFELALTDVSNNQDGKSNDNANQDKLVALLERLPATTKEVLISAYSSKNDTASAKSPTTPQQFLAAIEGSHKALNQENGEIDSEHKNPLPVGDNKLNHEKTNQAAANMAEKTVDKTNVNTEKLAMFESSTDITVGDENNETSRHIQRENQIIAQLESSFRNASSSNGTAESVLASRSEQQAIKEANMPQSPLTKQAEVQQSRIALNDNGVAAQQLKEHLTMMSRGGLGHAVLQLDPEELGAMSVRITMQNDQMNVQFQVQNGQAKDMLEQAMNKLKDSLQEQGIELNHSDVSQQDGENSQSSSGTAENQRENNEELDESDIEPITLVLNKQSTNGIDYYA